MELRPDFSTLLYSFRSGGSKRPASFRVGVVFEGPSPAAWVHALVDFLAQVPGFEVLPVGLIDREVNKPRPPWLTGHLYSASCQKFDPFGPHGLASGEIHCIEEAEAITAKRCEILVWLAAIPEASIDLARLSRYGALSVKFGKQDCAVPLWHEVANRCSTSATTVYWHEGWSHERRIRTAETATQLTYYVTMNAQQSVIAAIRMLAALCLELQQQPAVAVSRFREVSPVAIAPRRVARYPSNTEAASFLLSRLAASVRSRSMTRGTQLEWFVALRPNTGGALTDVGKEPHPGFKDIPLPPGVSLMADPFLWEGDSETHLFFEAVAQGTGRGRLGRMQLNADGRFGEMEIVLDCPFHVSYPCIVASEGDLFLLPETSEAREVCLWRFTSFPSGLELVSRFAEDVCLVDTTPIRVEDVWYFFTTTLEPFAESFLFVADRLEGPWKLHPCNPISGSVKSGRSAGHLFWRDGRLYRPTQDCSIRYGYAIMLNEVVRLTPHEFEERRVGYLGPSWRRGLLGTHTWNESSSFQVVDGLRLG